MSKYLFLTRDSRNHASKMFFIHPTKAISSQILKWRSNTMSICTVLPNIICISFIEKIGGNLWFSLLNVINNVFYYKYLQPNFVRPLCADTHTHTHTHTHRSKLCARLQYCAQDATLSEEHNMWGFGDYNLNY